MKGRLYTCVRCGKNVFIPCQTLDDLFTAPKDWKEITMAEDNEETWACNTCAEIYRNFQRAFRNNTLFAMNPIVTRYNNIIEEVTKNGSEQTPVEQHTCDASDACPIKYPDP